MPVKIIVTGAAGFIGFHTCKRLLNEGFQVLGIDNINDYYDVNLKNSRLVYLNHLNPLKGGIWEFKKGDLQDKKFIEDSFLNFNPEIIINLAAQAGVRYSIKDPESYINSNIVGFLNVLEACRFLKISNFLYASSSSVYGGNKNLPFKESDFVDNPLSLYAATKKSNELMAYSYSHLYGIPSIGMRFFTVYGPWGRPDMAPMIFANSILQKKPISIFNYGKMKRDFTYIDDVVECIIRCTKNPPKINYSNENIKGEEPKINAPHKILNIGKNSSIDLFFFIHLLEKELGEKAIKEFLPIQNGDVPETYADINELYNWINFKPKTNLKEGVKYFAEWFIDYYKK
mgnify:FL=1